MTKNDYVTMINEMLYHYTFPLEASGINVDKYRQEFEKRSIPQLKEGHHWLLERTEAIANYKKIRALLSEEIWEQYKHMDTEDFREVKLLNEAIAKIKKAFVGRPALFRKVKDASKCRRSQTTEA